MDSEKKIFRVIKIIDDMRIVINCGERDGVKEGDCFRIFSNESFHMQDPFSDEDLGEFRQVKAKVEITTLYEKMCVCQNARKTIGLADMATLPDAIDFIGGKRFALNVEISDISGDLYQKTDEPIRVGDEVEKVN